MPIEVRRFGVGYRRREGPPGSAGVADQVIASDEHGSILELAFARGGHLEPHASPNPAWLIVIEGGGWVGVGEERTRIAAGEAVLWPADIPHAAWTEHSQMRAFVIESRGDEEGVSPLLQGQAREIGAGEAGPVDTRGAVRLGGSAPPVDADAGEPA